MGLFKLDCNAYCGKLYYTCGLQFGARPPYDFFFTIMGPNKQEKKKKKKNTDTYTHTHQEMTSLPYCTKYCHAIEGGNQTGSLCHCL